MPILDRHTLDLISHSPEQTRRYGARLGALLRGGDIVCTEGVLGTGKTCLAQGIGQGLGIAGPITSPTFTIVAEYRRIQAPTLYHIDLYRLAEPVNEALALGLDDYLLGDGICVIEWADRILPILPGQRLWISLRHIDVSKRGLMMNASGERYDQLVQSFRTSAFGM
ncbi:tRNA (adenosine(37)-N6)-threonylcarbamoyltransferase complex ATPase subunit type 1 TsaE [Chloroflexota bacterium]